MSGYPTILVHLSDDPGAETRLAYGHVLASRFQSHLIALYTVQPISVAAVESAYSQGFLSESVEISREHGKRLQVAVERIDEQRGTQTEWRWDESAPMASLSTHATVADLLIVGHSKSETGRIVFYGPENSVLTTGCPVMVLSQPFKIEHWPKTAVILWQENAHCLRAVRDSLPLLKQAQQVKIIGIHADPETAVVFLERHGITTQQANNQPADPEALRQHIASMGADLLVMGADGYAQQGQPLLGRVTQEITETMTLPIFWSH